MGFLDKLFGREPHPHGERGYTMQPYSDRDASGAPADGRGAYREMPHQLSDAQAVARYRYLVRTAPPETIEEVHADAFGRLTASQRQQVLERLSTDLPESERPRGDDPREMARAATRAELRQPGYMESSFGRRGGLGGAFGGSLMGTIAGVMVGSMLYDAMFDGYGDSPEAAEVGETGLPDTSAEGALPDGGDDGGQDLSGDAGPGAGDVGDGGFGGGFGGDFGGDFGGGDFGGGDF